MKRILSILLTLVLGLAPSIAAVPASAFQSGWRANGDESTLPACCRKNGAHHCAMNLHAHLAAQLTRHSSSRESSLCAVNTCPRWPGALASSATQVVAVAATTLRSIEVPSQEITLPDSCTTTHTSPQREHPKRGPPSKTTL